MGNGSVGKKLALSHHKDLGSVPRVHILQKAGHGIVHTCNPSDREEEKGGPCPEKQGGEFRTTEADLQPLHVSLSHVHAHTHKVILGTFLGEWGPGRSGDLQVTPPHGFCHLYKLFGPAGRA